MPAHDFEVEEALEEGVLTRWLNMIRQVDGNAITVEEMNWMTRGTPNLQVEWKPWKRTR